MPYETEFEELHKRIRNYLGLIQGRLDIPADNTDVSGYDLYKLTADAVTEAEVQRRHLEATQRFRGGFDRMYGEASREIRNALEQAKAILLDASKRAAYDRWLEERRRTTEPSRPSPIEQIEMTLDILIRDGSITVSEKTRLLTKARELGIAASDVESLLRRRGVRTISDAERAEAERRRWEREEAERREREEAERRKRTEVERREREETERRRHEREEAERRARRAAKAKTFRRYGLRFAYLIVAMLVLWFAVRPIGAWLWQRSRQQRVTQQQRELTKVTGNGSPKFTLPANPTPGMAFTNPIDNAVMVYIPEGEFIMGTSDEQIDALLRQFPNWNRSWFDNEKPQHRVYLDSYWIYKHEVTVAQYRKFCNETRRQMPSDPPWGWQNNHPIVNASWNDAVEYCQWAGVRLPTEAQWEKASHGTDGRIWSWGNQWDSSKCNSDASGIGKTTPVGSYPSGASPYGLMDMAGNVWEWCADWYDENYYASAPAQNPPGPSSGTTRVLRGGSWYDVPLYARAANRNRCNPIDGYYGWGFRCSSLRFPR